MNEQINPEKGGMTRRNFLIGTLATAALGLVGHLSKVPEEISDFQDSIDYFENIKQEIIKVIAKDHSVDAAAMTQLTKEIELIQFNLKKKDKRTNQDEINMIHELIDRLESNPNYAKLDLKKFGPHPSIEKYLAK